LSRFKEDIMAVCANCGGEIKGEEKFCKACGNQAFWEKEKRKRPLDFKRPGFVSLAFLADIWKSPWSLLIK
jgi:predicted amidophosphoribosyltransferase